MPPAVKAQKHVIADLWDCPADILADEPQIRRVMLEAAQKGRATVIDDTFHRFQGGGITGVVTVKESHLTIHTWPERGYAAVDIFLCGKASPQAALAHLVKQLRPKRKHVREHLRSDAPDPASKVSSNAITHRTGQQHMHLLYLVTLVVAMCSIIYELLLAQTLSALLGNTVLRYSITIGCYLGALGVGALLCGSRPDRAIQRLIRIELALSALGGVSVALFYFLDTIQRLTYFYVDVGSVWETLAPAFFFLLTHAVIVGIGLLSGFEVPLLLALGEEFQPRSTNKLLGVDYFGALVGSVLFPLVLLRSFGLLATGFSVALLNAAAAVALIIWVRDGRQARTGLASAAIAASLIVALMGADRIEQYFLKRYYYFSDVDSPTKLFAPMSARPDIERHRSPYQTIDLMTQPVGFQWIYDELSTKSLASAEYPNDLWLYLDRNYQLFSGSDEIYHEWFVHAPVQANGRALRNVLMLGGGDGLAIRELLKYATVRRIVHVDIDPEMLRLAREHPLLSLMNGHAHNDERVEVVQADAFHWLRNNDERFDGVYIDMPLPRDYNLSLVYSREFYTLVRRHLQPDGFVAIDTPSGWCGFPDNLWEIYYSTLRAAGFETVVPMLSILDAGAPRVASAVNRMAAQTEMEMPAPGGKMVPLTASQREAYFGGVFEEQLQDEGNVQEFMLAFSAQREINTEWRADLSVPTHVFGPYFLPLAFSETCPTDRDRTKVNSIARPTLPRLQLLSVQFP